MKEMRINNQLELFPDRNEVLNLNSNEIIKLEPRLTKILMLLLNQKGKVVPRNEIIHTIWGNYNSGEDLLTHSISQLRKSLGNNVIKTIPKKGYMIVSEKLPNTTNFQMTPKQWMAVAAVLCYVVLRIALPHH